jgi:hypothetical protein
LEVQHAIPEAIATFEEAYDAYALQYGLPARTWEDVIQQFMEANDGEGATESEVMILIDDVERIMHPLVGDVPSRDWIVAHINDLHLWYLDPKEIATQLAEY